MQELKLFWGAATSCHGVCGGLMTVSNTKALWCTAQPS